MTSFGTQGRFDGIDHNLVYGWASGCPEHRELGIVDVLIDGRRVETLVADQFRPDLEEAGIRGGRAGFFYEIPETYCDGASHRVEVHHHGTDQPLAGSPHAFTLSRSLLAADTGRTVRTPSHLVLQDGSQSEDFEDRLRLARKVAVVSTYHDAGRFLGYHEALFRTLSENGFVTIVVHASSEPKRGVAAPRTAGCYTILKRNVGYDFGSWAVAMYRLRAHFELIDEMVLLNDSVIPIDVQALGALLRRARSSGADVVGLTDSYEHTYHLQSYLIWLGTPALRAAAFRDFMAAYSFSSVKAVVIEEGELALTKRFLDAGFSVQALFEYDEVASLWLQNVGALMAEIENLPAATASAPNEDYRRVLTRRTETITASLLDGRPMNPSHFFWDTLIERCGFPLLKRELVLVNPCNVPTYFRIGRVLQAQSEARGAIKEIRRVYGGNLLPMFMPRPATALLPVVPAQAGQATLRSVSN